MAKPLEAFAPIASGLIQGDQRGRAGACLHDSKIVHL